MTILEAIVSITFLVIFTFPFQSLLKESDCKGKIAQKTFIQLTQIPHFSQQQKKYSIYQWGCSSRQSMTQNNLEIQLNENKFRLKDISN